MRNRRVLSQQRNRRRIQFRRRNLTETMHIQIYSKPQCPYCDMALRLAEQITHETAGYTYNKYMLDEDFNREQLLEKFPTARTFPQITIDGESIGGYTEFKDYIHRTHNPNA